MQIEPESRVQMSPILFLLSSMMDEANPSFLSGPVDILCFNGMVAALSASRFGYFFPPKTAASLPHLSQFDYWIFL